MAKKKKMAIDELIELDEAHNLGLCHGLAPNPFGFTFEATGKKALDKKVGKLLEEIELSPSWTAVLLSYMRGGNSNGARWKD